MNSMNDEHFFDLAMKVISRQVTDAERAELDALLAREPERKTEFARLQAEVRVAKEALPLVNATEATAGELPAYARGRLQTKVRQTLGRPAGEKEPDRSFAWGLRWWLGLAAAVVVVLVVLPGLRTPSGPVIQVAMLDLGGATRGGDTNEVTLLNQSWQNAKVDSFASADELRAWETNWPAIKQPAIKIIYDRAAGEVRILGRWEGKPVEKTFLIEQDLATTLKLVREFIEEQTKR
jgi:hypothetical protein